jgi:hypothetical protein
VTHFSQRSAKRTGSNTLTAGKLKHPTSRSKGHANCQALRRSIQMYILYLGRQSVLTIDRAYQQDIGWCTRAWWVTLADSCFQRPAHDTSVFIAATVPTPLALGRTMYTVPLLNRVPSSILLD